MRRWLKSHVVCDNQSQSGHGSTGVVFICVFKKIQKGSRPAFFSRSGVLVFASECYNVVFAESSPIAFACVGSVRSCYEF